MRKGNILNSNCISKLTNNNNNEKINSNDFRANNYSNNITRKGRLKKSLTINKIYKFIAEELLKKK